MLFATCHVAVADNLSQNFNSWPDLPLYDFGNYADGNGWYISDGLVDGGVYIVPYSVNSALLNSYTAPGKTYLRTPRLTYGIGKISFYVANDVADASFAIQTATATNGPWSTVNTFLHDGDIWTFKTFTINDYGTGIYVRILKTADAGSLSGFDNVVITNPPAKVAFANPRTSPSPAYAERTTHLLCDITPLGIANGLVVTSYWKVGSGLWTGIKMSKQIVGNTWRTDSPIPGQSTGAKIYYYFSAQFLGNQPLSPTNYPWNAPGTTFSFTAQPRPPNSIYQSIDITGDFATNMLIVADYQWQGIYRSAGNIVNGQFRFRAAHTNGIETNYWGDLNQNDSVLPIPGFIDINGNNINVTGTNTGSFAFQMNENTRAYAVRKCLFRDFEDWTTGGFVNSTNQQWTGYRAWVHEDTDRQIRGAACYLDSSGPAALRSARLPDGIGEVSFWYRNYSTSGVPATGFIVQKSETGGTNEAEWLTFGSLSDIVTLDYARYSITINDRHHPYMRIRITTNAPHAGLCLDDILITHAGSGVVISNVTIAPASPTLVDPVLVSARMEPRAGATNLQFRAHWRFGTGGTYQVIGMTNSGSGTYTATNRISASNGSAAGKMEYYLSCTYTGYQSSLASPITYPKTGAAGPTSYVARPAVTFSNAVRYIANPCITQEVPVSVELYPYNKVTNQVVYVVYRSGLSGGFDPRALSKAAGNTYTGAVPRGPVGTMQYYFNASYGGVESPYRVSSWYPTNAPLSLYTYTNTDHWLSQNFDSWTGAPSVAWGNWTNGGWIVRDGVIADTGSFPGGLSPHSVPNACWLDAHSAPTTTNMYFRAPLHRGAIGSVAFRMNNHAPGITYASLETAQNPAGPWTVIKTFSHIGMAWTNHVYSFVSDVTNAYLRIRKTGDSTDLYTGIENFFMSHRPASVYITNVVMHPGYPSDNQPVHISCQILSANSVYPPMGISPSVYYRYSGQTAYTGPVPMTTNGSFFTTATPIPGRPARTRVDFYIRAAFKGYYYFAWENRSPSYYPQGVGGVASTQYYLAPTNSPASYFVRTFDSEHSSMVATTSLGTVTMDLLDDGRWEGVFRVPADTNSLSFTVVASSRYTNNASEYAAAPEVFGDNAPPDTTIPMGGIASVGAAPVVLSQVFSVGDLVLIQFNSTDNSYMVRRGTVQDFDRWDAPDTFFAESADISGYARHTNLFNHWPASQTTFSRESFSSWPAFNYYTNWWGPGDGWKADKVKILEEPDTNRSCQLSATSGDGQVWPEYATLPRGVGTFSFKYRTVYEDNFLSTCIPGSGWFGYIAYADMAISQAAPDPYVSLFARYVAETNYYECRLVKRQAVPTQLQVQIRRQNGSGSSASTLLASSNYTANIIGTHKMWFMVATNNSGAVLLRAGVTNRCWVEHNDTNTTRINRNGTIALFSRNATVAADNIVVQKVTDAQNFSSWSAASHGTYTNRGWVIVRGKPRAGTDVYLYYTNAQDTYVMTPYQAGTVGRLEYQYSAGSHVSDKGLVVEGSNAGVWTVLQTLPFTTNNTWYSGALVHPTTDLSSYRRFRIRNTATTAGTQEALRLDNIRIMPYPNVVLNDNFNAGTSTNWNAPFGAWSVSAQAYRRSGYVGPNIQVFIQTAVTNNHVGDGPWPAFWTNATMFLANSLTYSNKTFTFNTPRDMFVSVKHGTGTASVVVDDIAISSWKGQSYTNADGWRMWNAWISTNVPPTNMAVELPRSRAWPTNAAQAVATRLFTNGIGTLAFDIRVVNPPALIWIEKAIDPLPNIYGLVKTRRYTTAGTTRSKFYIQTGGVNASVRIRNVSTNLSSNVIIDNVEVSDSVSLNDSMWYAYNAMMTHNQDAREFEPGYQPDTAVQTCYLNNDPSIDTDGETLVNDSAFVESARIPTGIGEIRFWYRNWQGSGSPASRIRVAASGNRLNPPGSWTTICTITNITNTAYALFTTNCYNMGWRHVRFYGSDLPLSRACIDDILVAEPIAANLDILSLQISPVVPIYTNQVRFSAELGTFLAKPTNINVRLYYATGTNNWAAWPTNNSVLLDRVTTNGAKRTYTSDTLLGPFPIDTVLQYFVKATFQGLSANLTSPKTFKQYSIPSWYEPMDYNTMHGATNPFLISFSCPTGHVWVNEINHEWLLYSKTNEFVEVAGRAGSIVQNWALELVRTVGTRYGRYAITNVYLPNHTNGYGFWVLGDSNISASLRNSVFTNSEQAGDAHLYRPGAVRIVRSCGTYADRVSYGTVMTGYRYAGAKSAEGDYSISMKGTGTTVSAFSWTNGYALPVKTTVHGVNWAQTFTPVPYNPPPEDVHMDVEILDIWKTPTDTWLVFSATGNVASIEPVVWYATNAVPAFGWNLLTEPGGYMRSGNIYTQWFANQTNSSRYFYRIHTNAP